MALLLSGSGCQTRVISGDDSCSDREPDRVGDDDRVSVSILVEEAEIGREVGRVPALVFSLLGLGFEPLVELGMAFENEADPHCDLRMFRPLADCLTVGIGNCVRGAGVGIGTAPRDLEPQTGTGEAVATVAAKLTSDIGDLIESLTFILVVILVVMFIAGDNDGGK